VILAIFRGRFFGVPGASRMLESDWCRFENFMFAMVVFFLADGG